MVVQFNFKSIGGCLQFARSLDVFPARLGIGGRMIVHNNESGGVEDQVALHNLSLVNGFVTNRAALLHLVGVVIVPSVKWWYAKLVDLLASPCCLQVSCQVRPI